MNRNKLDKGNRLELAVRSIEEVILKESQSLKENTFMIEMKKIVSLDGVRHELDVWVQVLIADGYNPVFIFECKNWTAKVGKNEVIIFSEKVASVGATRGFLVAESYTRDAIAQARKDTRIQLLHSKEVLLEQAVEYPLRVVARQKPHKAEFAFRFKDESSQRLVDDQSVVRRNGELPTKVLDFLQRIAHEQIESAFSAFDAKEKDFGDYQVVVKYEEQLAGGEVFIESSEVAAIVGDIKFGVKVTRPRIRSYFDVQKRGRFYAMEDIEVDGCRVELSFVHVHSSKPGL